jgi:hypothetical protein
MRASFPLVALLASSALVAGCGVRDPYQQHSSTTPTSPTASTPATPTRSPDEDEGAPARSPGQRDRERQADRAARAFLSGYLRYSYGQASGSAIHAATLALRRELTRHPPRVTAKLAKSAQPRVTSLRVTGGHRDRVYLLAQVTDRHNSYAATLTATRRGDRWLISEVQ